MSRIETPWRQVVSDQTKFGSGVFTPMTQALNSTVVKRARLAFQLAGVGNGQSRAAVQYSNDGVNWNTAVGLGNWSTSGWEYPSSWEDMPPSGQPDRLFVRFGLLTTNSAGSVTECHSAKMVVDIEPVRGARTITTDTVLCMSPKTGAGGGAGVVRPMTEALSTDGIAFARATWNLQGETGFIVTRAWYQTSEDGVNWNGGQSLSSTSRNNDGWKYNTDWTDLNLAADDRFIRFCIRTTRPGGNNTQQMGQCTLRIDVRGE